MCPSVLSSLLRRQWFECQASVWGDIDNMYRPFSATDAMLFSSFDADSSAVVKSSLCRVGSPDLSFNTPSNETHSAGHQSVLKEPPKSSVGFLMRCNMFDLRLDWRRIMSYHSP